MIWKLWFKSSFKYNERKIQIEEIVLNLGKQIIYMRVMSLNSSHVNITYKNKNKRELINYYGLKM